MLHGGVANFNPEVIINSPETHHALYVAVGAVVVLGTGAVAAWAFQHERRPLLERAPNRFSNENITTTFVAALPTITRQLNLEIATTHQVEILERKDSKALLGGVLDLGTSVALLRVPVTYRYRIRLYDRWKLRVSDNRLIVESPIIRASMPPAIHTDAMSSHAVRGCARRLDHATQSATEIFRTSSCGSSGQVLRMRATHSPL